MDRDKPLLFSTASYEYLRDRVADSGTLEVGHVERKLFPDGERYQRIIGDVSLRQVLLLGGTISDTDTLEIFDLACALVKYGAESLTLIIPYFGYSTMDRAVRHGEVVTAKTRACLLSSIPIAQRGNAIALLDLHAEGLAFYFEGAMTPVHISARALVKTAARKLGGADFVLACTDAGRAKWVQNLADEMGIPASFVLKRRMDGDKVELTAVSAHVDNRSVVIYDDMIRTGNSLITAGQAYREAGARKMSVVVTHGVFPGDALKKLQDSKLFDKIMCTDSHPRAVQLQGDFLEVTTVGTLLANAIKQQSYAVTADAGL